jgi:polyphosphate kinase
LIRDLLGRLPDHAVPEPTLEFPPLPYPPLKERFKAGFKPI